jgi:hypothetical protein
VLKVSCGFDGSPTGRDDLVEKGAALKIDLGFDTTWTPDQNAPPRAIKTGVIALLDTGAEQSFLDVGLASELKLALYDERAVIGVHGSQPASWYIAQVHFPALKFTVRGEFAALPLIKGGIGYHALIGRTFLRYIRMEYDGVSGAVTIFRDDKLPTSRVRK